MLVEMAFEKSEKEHTIKNIESVPTPVNQYRRQGWFERIREEEE